LNLKAGSLTVYEFNKLADQTHDFAVDERGEAIGDDGIMSAHPPSFVRNKLKEEESHQLLENGHVDAQEIGMRNDYEIIYRKRIDCKWNHYSRLTFTEAKKEQ
jgi:hypothetical protein